MDESTMRRQFPSFKLRNLIVQPFHMTNRNQTELATKLWACFQARQKALNEIRVGGENRAQLFPSESISSLDVWREVIRSVCTTYSGVNGAFVDFLLLDRNDEGGSLCDMSGISSSEHRESACLVILDWLIETSVGSNNPTLAHDQFINVIAAISRHLEMLPSKLSYRILSILSSEMTSSEAHIQDLLVIIPKALLIVTRCEKVQLLELTDKCAFLSGLEWKNYFINKICSSRWYSRNILPLMSVFRECDLSESQSQIVCKKALAQFSNMENSDMGLFMHQLLLFSKANATLSRPVIEGICSHGQNLFQACKDPPETQTTLQHIQVIQSCLFQINISIKQDQEFGNEFLKFLKANPSHLNLFSLCVCLMMIKTQRYTEKCHHILKSTSAFSVDASAYHHSPWLHAFGHRFRPIDLKQLLMMLCEYPWSMDQIASGILSFSFYLLRSSCTGNKAENSTMPIDLTLHLFVSQPLAQRYILQEILEEIESQSTNAAFYDLLAAIASKDLSKLLPHVVKLRNILYSLSSLPLISAVKFLRLIIPILEYDESLKDTWFMTMRKHLFSKDAKSRLMAINGYLSLLSAQQEHDAARYVASSSQISPPRQQSSQVTLEILGNLRRCLTQQYEVRHQVYLGLLAFLRKSPEFACDIFDMVYPQFQKYYTADLSKPAPVFLSSCLDFAPTIRLSEPVPQLLNLLWSCLVVLLEDPYPAQVYLACQDMMNTFSRRLLKADIEDFELDKGADYSVITNTGLHNLLKSQLLLGCYESMFAYSFVSSSKPLDAESWQLVQRFHRRMEDLNFVKMTYQSVLELPILAECCEAFHDSTNLDADFQSFLIRALHACACSSPQASLHLQTDNAEDLLQLGQACLAILKRGHGNIKKKNDLMLVCESFEKAVSRARSKSEFLARIFNIPIELVNQQSSSKVMNGILTSLLSLSQSLLPSHGKEAAVFLRITQSLASDDESKPAASADGPLAPSLVVQAVEKMIATRTPPDDMVFITLAMKILLADSKRRSDYEMMGKFATEVQLVFRLIDLQGEEEIRGGMEPQFKISTVKSGPVIANCLLTILDEDVASIEWALGRKASAAIPEDDPLENVVASRLGKILVVLLEIEKACIPDGVVEPLLRILSKSYKILTALTKRRLKRAEVTDAFLSLSERACLLTNHVYSLIHFLQQRDTENASHRKGSIKSKINRESKAIPNLIYLLEIFERYLLQLNAKVDKNLLRFMKRSTARDFRIQVQDLKKKPTNPAKKRKGDIDTPEEG